jgi:hypothetical protein
MAEKKSKSDLRASQVPSNYKSLLFVGTELRAQMRNVFWCDACNKEKKEASQRQENTWRRRMNWQGYRDSSAYRNILQRFAPQGLEPMWQQKNYNIVGGRGPAASVASRSILLVTNRKLRESVGWRRLRAISRGCGGCLAGLCPSEWFARLG